MQVMHISSVKVASNFLFRLNIRHVGRMNRQVRLLNSLVRLAGRVNSELVCSMRNTERMTFNSKPDIAMPSKMSYLLLISSPCQNRRIVGCSLAESQNVPCQNCSMLGNYSPCESRRVVECLEIKIVSAVNQICHFASTKKKKPNWKLTVACHRHPTE